MNDRIKELAEQATKRYLDYGGENECKEFNKEKFAELIVRECIEQCSYSPGSNDEWDKGVKWAANQIAQHFGVEE